MMRHCGAWLVVGLALVTSAAAAQGAIPGAILEVKLHSWAEGVEPSTYTARIVAAGEKVRVDQEFSFTGASPVRTVSILDTSAAGSELMITPPSRSAVLRSSPMLLHRSGPTFLVWSARVDSIDPGEGAATGGDARSVALTGIRLESLGRETCERPFATTLTLVPHGDSALFGVLSRMPYEALRAVSAELATFMDQLGKLAASRAGVVPNWMSYADTLVSSSPASSEGPSVVFTVAVITEARLGSVDPELVAVPSGLEIIDIRGKMASADREAARRDAVEQRFRARYDTSATAPEDSRATCRVVPR